MQKTFNLLSTMREPALKDATNETLARLYQVKPSNAILAEAFCKNYEMFFLLTSKFKQLDEEDRASITLTQLEKALRNYDETKLVNNKTIKFSTYAYNIIRKGLLTAALYFKHSDRNKVSVVSLDDEVENGSDCIFADIIEDETFTWDNVDFKILIEKNNKLNTVEKQYCLEFLTSKLPDAKMVSERFGLNPAQSFQLRKKIKEKLYNEMEI